MEDPYGWTVELFQCQRPGRTADRWYASENEARLALQAVYDLGASIGTWRRRTYLSDAELRDQETTVASSPGFRRTKARHANRSS
jgi:hypothetical protein